MSEYAKYKKTYWQLKQHGIYTGMIEVILVPGGGLIRHFGCTTRHEVTLRELRELTTGGKTVEWPE